MPIDHPIRRKPKSRFLEIRQEIFYICDYNEQATMILSSLIGWHWYFANREEDDDKPFSGWMPITREKLRRSCFGMICHKKIEEAIKLLVGLGWIETSKVEKLVTTQYRLNVEKINEAIENAPEGNSVPGPDEVPNRKAGYIAKVASALMLKEENEEPSALMLKDISINAEAASALMLKEEPRYKEAKSTIEELLEEPPSPQPPSQGKGELEDSLLHATKSKAPELGSAGIDSVTTTRLTSDCASEIIRCTIGRGSLSKQAIRLIDDFDWSTWDEDQLRSETTRLADYKPEQFMASVAGAPVKRSASFRGGRMSRSSQPKQSRYGAKTQPSVDLGGAVAWSEWFKDAAKHAQPLMDAELPLLAECLQDKDFRNNSQKLLEALDACASSDSEWKPTLSWAVRGNPKNWTRVVAGEFAPKKISRKSKDFDVVDSAKDLVKRMREKGRL